MGMLPTKYCCKVEMKVLQRKLFTGLAIEKSRTEKFRECRQDTIKTKKRILYAKTFPHHHETKISQRKRLSCSENNLLREP